jgi:hypothetical protein
MTMCLYVTIDIFISCSFVVTININLHVDPGPVGPASWWTRVKRVKLGPECHSLAASITSPHPLQQLQITFSLLLTIMTTSAKDNKGTRPGKSEVMVLMNVPAAPPSDDESTIKVAPKKDSNPNSKDKPLGLKLKKSIPKIDKAGSWKHGSVVDGES